MLDSEPQQVSGRKPSVEEEFEKRRGTVVSFDQGIPINASGHKDQLQRQYGLLGICGLAL